MMSPTKAGEKEEEEERKSGREEGTLWLVLEEIRKLRVETEKGREEVKGEIKNLESKINRVEKRWMEKEAEIENRLEYLGKRLEELEAENSGAEKRLNVKLKKMVTETRKITNVTGVKGEIGEKKYLKKTRKKIELVKKKLEESERQTRKNRIVIKDLKKGKGNFIDTVKEFLKKKFGVTEIIKDIEVLGREGRETAVVDLKDWKAKQEIMGKKNKLNGRKIYIEHDLTRDERKVQGQISRAR